MNNPNLSSKKFPTLPVVGVILALAAYSGSANQKKPSGSYAYPGATYASPAAMPSRQDREWEHQLRMLQQEQRTEQVIADNEDRALALQQYRDWLKVSMNPDSFRNPFQH